MNVRITKKLDAHETVLQIDGKLHLENVDELAKTHQCVEGPLVLDLSNLRSADTSGVDVLLQLVSTGAQIRGASPYIELLMKTRT